MPQYWVITATKGEYSDVSFWLVSVHIDQAEADALRAALDVQDRHALDDCDRIRRSRTASEEATYQAWRADTSSNALRDVWLAVGYETQRLVAAMMAALPYKVTEIDVTYTVQPCTNVPGAVPLTSVHT